MGLVAVPYRPFTDNPQADEARNSKILGALSQLPNLFPLQYTVEQRHVIIAATLVDPQNRAWEIWRGPELVGILLLTRIVRGLDALAHLAFFDKKLVGKRQLLRNMIAQAFRELDLHRLSVEIPAHLEPLIRFVRTKLDFQFEGEAQAAEHPALKGLPSGINNAPRWLAHWGSRREQMHFDGTRWHDVVLLRLLKSELEGYGRAHEQNRDAADTGRHRADALEQHRPPAIPPVREPAGTTGPRP